MQLCAMGRKKIKGALCYSCDIELNAYVMSFFRVRNRKKLIEDYETGLTSE